MDQPSRSSGDLLRHHAPALEVHMFPRSTLRIHSRVVLRPQRQVGDPSQLSRQLEKRHLILPGATVTPPNDQRGRVLHHSDDSGGHESSGSDRVPAPGDLGNFDRPSRRRYLDSASSLRGLDLVLQHAVSRIHHDLYSVPSHDVTLLISNDTHPTRSLLGQAFLWRSRWSSYGRPAG
jgi:hypothetical protein